MCQRLSEETPKTGQRREMFPAGEHAGGNQTGYPNSSGSCDIFKKAAMWPGQAGAGVNQGKGPLDRQNIPV